MRASIVLVLAITTFAHPARAQDPTTTTAIAPAPPLPPPPPYALPFQLRPAAVADVVRSDTAIARYDAMDGTAGTTVASTFLAAVRITPALAPLVRVAVAHDTAPTGTPATAVSNPLVGITYAPKLAAPLKLALLAAVTIPVGSGGGDTPDPARAATIKSGVLARSAMDNALFAVDDVAAIGGADLAWVKRGVTVQGEATLFQLERVRGGAVQPDAHKTNLTCGVFAGWTARPFLALGAELRYQRYLSTPAAVAADPTGASRDNLTAAIGVRTKIDLGGGRVLKPGLAYARGFDDPTSKRGYQILQIDLPLSF
jgi:hypothetical protein